jgi:hypothetical protein
VNQKRIGSYKNKMEMKIQVKLSNMKKAKWIIFQEYINLILISGSKLLHIPTKFT